MRVGFFNVHTTHANELQVCLRWSIKSQTGRQGHRSQQVGRLWRRLPPASPTPIPTPTVPPASQLRPPLSCLATRCLLRRSALCGAPTPNPTTLPPPRSPPRLPDPPLYPVNAPVPKTWRASPPPLSSLIPAGSGAAVSSSSLSPSSSCTSRTITSVSRARGGDGS